MGHEGLRGKRKSIGISLEEKCERLCIPDVLDFI